MRLTAEIEVRAGGGSHKIKIGRDLFALAASELGAMAGISCWAVIADSTVSGLYAPAFMRELKKRVRRAELFEFPPGEQSKTRETKQKIEDMMQCALMGRDSAVVALGGGVTGDIAGFVAATYCRGIPYVQIPTTLVACADSAIGGKTGVDTPAGKNLIGAFHQPAAVYADTALLSTLKKAEIAQGLAEVIKYGVIKDAELFVFLEKNMEKLFDRDAESISHIVARSCSIKAEVVEKDERENDLRKILNFGHTVGHAVEKLSDYSVPHGSAVGIGMVAEAEISKKMELLSESEARRIKEIVKAAGLPSGMPVEMEKQKLLDAMRMDKKARAGRIEMSLPCRIGEIALTDGRRSVAVDETLL